MPILAVFGLFSHCFDTICVTCFDTIMQYPKFRFVFDRKRVATKTKKGLVQLEVYSEGRRVFVSTGIKVYADQWKDTRKVINTPLAVSLNRTLDAMMQKFVDWAASLYAGGGEFDFDKLQRFLSSGNEGKTSFIDFVSSRLEERSDIRESTRKSQHKLIPSLRAFGHIKYFADLTKENIVKYDEYLHKKGYKQQTVHSYHKFMKIYINEAIRLGLLERNPYEGIKIERGKSELRKYLTQEELLRIQNAVIANVSICKVRDLFLFQCYTGFAYADLAAFDFGNVVQRNGKYVVHDARKKTGENFYVVLMAPAVDILRKYDFKLPMMTNVQYNLRLKILADYAGIDKDLTSHMGRHTFAVLCLNNGVPIETLAKMMGHTDIKTTQIYAKVLDEQVEQAFEDLEKKLPGHSPAIKKSSRSVEK